MESSSPSGENAATSARASARLSRAIASMLASRAEAWSRSPRATWAWAAPASVMMPVKPWASVSWISRARRSRSATTPDAWFASASSLLVRSSVSISSARCPLSSMILDTHMPKTRLTSTLTDHHGRLSRNTPPAQPDLTDSAVATPMTRSKVYPTPSLVRSLNTHACGNAMNSRKLASGWRYTSADTTTTSTIRYA